ncbi:nitroreductase family protein [Ktedonobacter racemifer]|uniref:Nitroreductase n=1 Tax=Ktedonobacter racemifer DSM 44963 TaxID=485913 RepID=D6TYZ6_KTERA|nr:nitroreductase family protein [Ktedonobacter racemifer]EFH81786.1 nitroreductase [Ktedonobacter racemifer DSM 44963]
MQEIKGKAQVAELIRTQRATRQYSQQAVSEEDIRTILNAGRRAQSSNNTQPWQFIVVRDREILKQLAEGGKYTAHVPHAAFAIALVASSKTGSADFDLGQAAAYLQLAAWDLGIGSCITWMHYPEKAKEALHVPTDLEFHIVLSFGYPAPQEHPQATNRLSSAAGASPGYQKERSQAL